MLQNRKPALIFLNRYFAPDHSATSQMLSDVAFGLATKGERVRVITSRLLYDDPDGRLAAEAIIRNVEVHRVWTSRFGRKNLAGRAIDYLTFYVSSAWALFRLARKGDIVIAKTDPPMLAAIAAPIARLRGARFVNWLQDIFPEVAEVLGVGRSAVAKPVFRLLRRLRDRSLRTADANVVLGKRMAERIVALGADAARTTIIANFADGENIRPVPNGDNSLRRSWNLGSAFVVGYSGNLGRAHEYGTLIDAIAKVNNRAPKPGSREIVWLFIGGGALYEAFRKEISARGLASVRFEPYQPREQLAESLSAADVHLVSLRPDLEGLIVPSKFYGIAAAGRPALFIGAADGEIPRLLELYRCGLAVPEGAGSQLADAIVGLSEAPEIASAMGQSARIAFDRDLDLPIAIGRWQTLLERLRADARPGAP